MNEVSKEFNAQLELDVLVNSLTEVTREYARNFNSYDFDEVIIPEGITSIKDELFSHSIHLKRIQLPKGLTNIGPGAFWNCTRLKTLSIPDSVTTIGFAAFYACRRLTSVVFKGKTMAEVCSMKGYPWDIPPEKISVQVP